MNLKSSIYSYQLGLRQRIAGALLGEGLGVPVDPKVFQPERVLFVLSGLIGDSVMSLPPITIARGLWPEAKIAVLGKRHNRELIEGCEFFDEFYEFNGDPFSIRRSRETSDLQRWLSRKHFDAGFILLGDQFAHLLARARIPVRVGVKGTPLEACLTHSYEIGEPRTWGASERLNAIRCLGYPVEDEHPRLKVGDAVRAASIEKLRKLGIGSDRYLVVHPFGSTKRQWWPLDRVSEFAANLHKQHNLEVVLTGGPDTVTSPAPNDADIIDTRGKLTLQELIAVIGSAKLVVTTDSGPFHIAGALGTPTVGLFRSRRPEHARQYPTATVVFGENSACATECDWDRCGAAECRQMQEISADRVISAVNSRFDRV